MRAMETESTPVVPAKQLLEVAGVLSDGAARLHRQLSALPPDERRALLEVVVGQVSDIVQAWSQLVRAVVPETTAQPSQPASGAPPAPAPGPARTAAPPPEAAAAPAPPVTPPEHAGRTAPVAQTTFPEQPASAGATMPAEPPPPGNGPETIGTRAFVGSGPPSAPPAPPKLHREPPSVSPPFVPPPFPGAGQHAGSVAPFLRPTENGDESPITHIGPHSVVEQPGDFAPHSRDELTGVLNRSAGFEALNREVERCQRDGERFVLGYLNVDGLQRVNETEGPRAGDDLLRKVAAALRATLRSYDVVLRLAGDEFLFSMPGADTTTATQRVQDFTVILGQEAPGASVSVGFAELRAGDTLDELVVRADDDLVEARRRRARPRLR